MNEGEPYGNVTARATMGRNVSSDFLFPTGESLGCARRVVRPSEERDPFVIDETTLQKELAQVILRSE